MSNISTVVTEKKKGKTTAAISTQKTDFATNVIGKEKSFIKVTRRKRFCCCGCLVPIYYYRHLKFLKYIVLILFKS